MDESYDWIVVGSGGGSMCSALVMRSLGKSVIILEKTDPIPGLYATGNSSAPAMGRYHVGAGPSIGASFSFGYIAAHHAANADNLAA